jgi:hypothetical protein
MDTTTLKTNEEDFDAEEIQMLEERWEKYIQDPSSAISLEEFKEQLKAKYGI